MTPTDLQTALHLIEDLWKLIPEPYVTSKKLKRAACIASEKLMIAVALNGRMH